MDVSDLNVKNLTNLQYLVLEKYNYGVNVKFYGHLDVSGCTALTNLNCNNNKLIYLYVSGCTTLTVLNCRYNELTYLNVKNGKNTLFSLGSTYTNFRDNPNLKCIIVDKCVITVIVIGQT